MCIERNYYMVRAQYSESEDFDIFFNNQIVAVGWSKVDFTKFDDSKKLRDEVYGVYYQDNEKAKQVVGKKLNEVERFKNIKEGDRILVPYYSSIVIAEACAGEDYSSEAFKEDLSNQRKVQYRYYDDKILRIPRDELSEGLQRRLRVQGNAVSNLNEFSDEIEKLFSRESYSFTQDIIDFEAEKIEKFKIGLLSDIQNGKTGLKTGGIGLENLVCELMVCEGYDAKVLPKRAFIGKADADISAVKEDHFVSSKIFVQVKHHWGNTGKEAVTQIIKVLEQDMYKDYIGYVVTSAMMDDETRKYASDNNIQIMDGNGLIELILDNMDKLSNTTKRILGICTVPRLTHED